MRNHVEVGDQPKLINDKKNGELIVHENILYNNHDSKEIFIIVY